MQLSISEILNKASKMKGKSEKVRWLKQNNFKALKTVLKAMYDPNLVCLLPKEEPPYTPSKLNEDHGMLINNSRKIVYFYEPGGSRLRPSRRESLFIELLESVNRADAVLLIDMKDKRQFKGLTEETINAAFPDLIPEKSV
jgi:hypothetical protein